MAEDERLEMAAVIRDVLGAVYVRDRPRFEAQARAENIPLEDLAAAALTEALGSRLEAWRRQAGPPRDAPRLTCYDAGGGTSYHFEAGSFPAVTEWTDRTVYTYDVGEPARGATRSRRPRPSRCPARRGVPMHCYCCDAEVALARKVKLRPWRHFDPARPDPGGARYQSYCEEMTFRWAVLCPGCYRLLDNDSGVAAVSGRTFDLAGASRGDQAPVLDEARYRAFRRPQARALGLDLDDDQA
jgi:hypothetical protein